MATQAVSKQAGSPSRCPQMHWWNTAFSKGNLHDAHVMLIYSTFNSSKKALFNLFLTGIVILVYFFTVENQWPGGNYHSTKIRQRRKPNNEQKVEREVKYIEKRIVMCKRSDQKSDDLRQPVSYFPRRHEFQTNSLPQRVSGPVYVCF